MRMQAIRGATTVNRNSAEEILEATQELLVEITKRNELLTENLISVIFTMTNDLDAAFPARAARNIGWTQVPLLCCSEIPVPGSLPRCIRVLIHCLSGTDSVPARHVYLRDAVGLRSDLTN